MADKVSLGASLGRNFNGRRRAADEPARILMLGDFSANGASGNGLAPRKVDFETLDTALAAMAPSVTLKLKQPVAVTENITIGSMEDFHPDSLVRKLGVFQYLRSIADRLADPEQQEQAMSALADLAGETDSVDQAPPAAAQQETADVAEDDGDMVERLLGSPAGTSSKTVVERKVESLIQEALGSAQTAAPNPSAAQGQQRISDFMTSVMRQILGLPQFQSIERAWRSVEWLIQRLDDETAEIFILDLSRDKLDAHLETHAEHLDRSALHRIISAADSGKRWDAIIGDYSFGLNATDLLALTTLGAIAGQGSVPLIAHGELNLCGCNSLDQVDAPWDWQMSDDELADLWTAVRGHPAARWIGLATPRILLRQPYGAETDPIDAFTFTELAARPDPSAFLWANPAIACASVIARTYASPRGTLDAGVLEIEDLPVALYDDGTGQALQAPVETLLSDRTKEQIENGGLMTMLGHRNNNAVRCADVFSVSAEPVSFLRR